MKILIADDHEAVIWGLRTYLKEQFSFISLAETRVAEQILNMLATEKTDILVFDIAMSGIRNLQFLSSIRKAYPNLGIVVYTQLKAGFKPHVLAAGADAFVFKKDDLQVLFQAIEQLQIRPRWKNTYGKSQTDNLWTVQKRHAFNKLSSREMEIMLLLFQGKKNKEISALTGLAPTSISTYKNRCFEKMEMNNLMDLRDLYWFVSETEQRSRKRKDSTRQTQIRTKR